MNINNLFKLIILIFNYQLYAAIGCMDNSFHMQLNNDKKEYHYVRCTCPCDNIIADRGRCMRCRHFGRPDRGEINALQELDPIFR